MPLLDLQASHWIANPWWLGSLLAADLLLRVAFACLIILRKGSQPSLAAAWVTIVTVMPLIGIPAYLLIGESRLGYRRRAIHKTVLELFNKPQFHQHADQRIRAVRLDGIDLQIARIAESVSGSPPLAGNGVKLFGDSDAAVAAIIADIKGATTTVHITSYIWLDDRVGSAVCAALAAATERGVICRVLVDAQGSARFLQGDAARQLRKRGVQVVAALRVHPLRALFSRIDIRNHRKMIIIDSNIGWIGSMNIAAPEFAIEPRFAPWVDCTLRLTGPTVRELHVIFAEDWYLDTSENIEAHLMVSPPFEPDGVTAQIAASGPNYRNDAIKSLLLAAIHVAQDEIVLTTPYFVPDPTMYSALCVAARRGVTVRLVVPRRNNSRLVGLASRAGYGLLLDSGVHIHEFTLGLLHAKTVSADGKFAIITSSNLDRRSFELNFEATALVYDDAFARELRKLQQSYIDASREATAEGWKLRTRMTRLQQNAAALISPLL
ncbi:MAG: cardiolipin synthase [Phycisphaerales bacterium]|nr:cardiolipin synthase [Phycisphaerales bacterium]